MHTVYALLGPTASGKSALALQLAATLPLEIVAMDSAQVYRGMDIGTAKPTREERTRAPHHLIDLVEPTESYSAGRWRGDAIRAIEDILRRERIPLVVGGTMLYYRALAVGLDALPQADPRVRSEIDAQAKRRGWPALHAELASVDPKTAGKLAANDRQRIQRALEVWRLTGRAPSDFHTGKEISLPFELKTCALIPSDRAELHRRIEMRFDAMLKAGLIEEVRELKRRYALNPALPSMRCVGYRQVWEYLEGGLDKAALREKGIAATRQLAKRQLTWLRTLPGIEVIRDPDPRACARALRAPGGSRGS